MLVTGNESGFEAYTAAPAKAITMADTTAHRSDERAVFLPILSFMSDAVPDASVITTMGTAMKMPRLMRYEDTADIMPAVPAKSPKSSAVASPMRSAAMYVIHVFIGKGYST